MVRRSWRDLIGNETPGESPASAPGDSVHASSSDSQPADPAFLQQVAAQAPTSQLADLLAERERLERYLASLTGKAPTSPNAARYPVAGLAERRAEIDAWARGRDADKSASGPGKRTASATSPTSSTAAPVPAWRPYPPGPTDRPPSAGREAVRPIEQGLSRDATAAVSRPRSKLFGPLRSALDRYERVTAPVRDAARQVTGFADQLNDLDRTLAAEGVSQSERDKVRRELGAGAVERIAGPLRRADEALARPRQLAGALENRWQQREQQWSGPLDRFGAYAASRDRVLGMDTGGSGDLFARADAARQRALDRRAEQDREERRAEQVHERQHERRVAQTQDAERLDRRGTHEKRD